MHNLLNCFIFGLLMSIGIGAIIILIATIKLKQVYKKMRKDDAERLIEYARREKSIEELFDKVESAIKFNMDFQSLRYEVVSYFSYIKKG